MSNAQGVISFEELVALYQEWVDTYDENPDYAFFSNPGGSGPWRYVDDPDEMIIDGHVVPFPTWVQSKRGAT